MKSSTRARAWLPSWSAFAGFRFPPEVIVVAVRWYLRFNLSYRDVQVLLERDVEVDHVSVYRWVQRFTPLLADAARFGLWAPLVTQSSIEVPPRSRLTAWLRHQLADATARANRAVSEVAAQYQVAWHTVRKELIAAAAAGCPPRAQRCWVSTPAPAARGRRTSWS